MVGQANICGITVIAVAIAEGEPIAVTIAEGEPIEVTTEPIEVASCG